MIQGIGTDLIDINRIEQKIVKNEYFKTHVFSESEIIYCESKKNPFMHYAARWAVKEAYLKAFGLHFIGNHKLPEIETIHDEHGNPNIRLKGKSLEDFEHKNFGTIHVSITHTDTTAMAFVIIESL